MGHSTSRLLGVLFVLALAANVRDATAEIYTWTQTTGGTYAWDTGEDWSGGLAPDPVSGDTVDLSTVNIAGNMTLTLDADRTATTWKFGDTSGTENWIVDAGSPAGKLMLAGSTPTITVNQNTTTINAIVDGTSLNKSGGGTLVLTGANTYTGLTRINSGTLSIDSIQNAGVSSPLGAYPTTAASGLVLYGGTLKYTGSTASSDRGLSIGGDWGQGTVNVATPGASLTLGNLTRYDAKDNRLNVSGGAGSSLKLTSVTNNNNIYFTNSIALTIDSITGIGVLEKNGTSVMYLNGVNTSYSGNIRLTQGQLNISNDNNLGTGPLSFDGGTLQFAAGSDVTLAAGRSVTMNSGKTSSVDTSLASGTIASVLSGSGNLTKIGDNALTLNAANIFTGTTKVTGGSLKLGVANALQFSVYDTTSSNGTTIGLDVNGFAAPTLGGLSGSVNLASAIVGYSGVTGLTLNPQSGSLTYSGGIADGATGMTVTKTGGGTQILSGVNAYTGATTVNAGLLRITGSTSASSAVSVTGGSIGGSGNGTTTGIIGGTVTLSGAGGVDLRDAAIGTLTLGGDLAIDGAAAANFLYFDLANNGTTTDKIVVGGNTTMSTTGAAVISLNQIGSRIQDGTYTLIQGTGTIPTATDFSLAAGKAFGMNFSLDVSGSNLQLTTARLASGPAAAFWAGGTDENWTTAGNWNTDATSGTSTAEGAPSYNTNVTFHTTNPAAGNLSNTMDADFDINSLTFAADATSPVAISGTNKTLTIEGSSGITVATPTSGTIEHTISANVGLAANQTWTVNPSATLTVSGNVTDFGGGRTLTKAGTGTLNLNGDTTVGSLQIAYNTSASAGTVVVGSGGSLSVGSGPVSNFYVGWGSGNNANGAGTLDASAASSFTANVGNFMVGGTCGGNGTVKLGADNMITASTQFGIEKGSWGGPNGYGTVTTAADSTTTIHTPIMYLGNDIPNGTTGGWGKFTLGSGGTLNLDGINGGRTDLSISWFWSGNGSSESTPSLMDLSGGAANLKLSSLVVGRREAGGGSGNYGIMTLGTSFSNHLDISGPGNVVLVGYCSGSGTGEGTLTLANLDATSAITSTANSTAILLGSKVSTGPANGTLNLNGGTLTITTTGTAIGGGGGTSNLNLDGVTLKAGASSTTWLQGLTAAKIKSGGVTFDTAGYDITIAQALLTNTVSLGGGLTKAGNGILTLTGANTYTGATNVNGGTFKLDAGGSIASALINVGGSGIFDVSTVTGGYTLASGKTLNGSGAVTGDVIADSDSLLAPGDGVSGGTLTLCNGLTLGTGANVQVSNPGSSVVQVNGVYTDDLGVHSLLGGGTMTLNQVSTFLHWSGATPAGMVTGQQSNWTVPAAGGVKNWIGSLSENWTNAGNWDGYAGEVWADTSAKTLSVKCTAPGVVPFALSDVVINPSTSGITVTGPASEAVAINSLQVGGANNSSPTLTLGAASFNVTGAVSVVSNGTLNAIDGGLVAATLNVSSAGAAATLGNASGNITAANVSAGTLTVNAGIVGTADLSGTGSLAGSAAVNQVNVTGGAPAFSGNATVMTVTGGGVTTTGGTIGAFNSNTGAVSSTIGGGTTVTTANVNAGTVNFNSTQANGTLALPAGSTGTVIVGSGAKVATADFSAGAGTVTANYPLTITNQIKLAGGTTATTDGPAFTAQSVSGSNIADNAAARTFTISGGTMTLAALSAPSVTGISYAQITNDADSGISSADTYTHALDFGSSGAATVNGVAFANDVNVSAGGRTNSGTRTYGPQVHGGNTPPAVSGSVASIFTDMRYDGPDGGYIELTGLTVGQWYDVRLYDRAWDYGGSVRTFYAGYDVGSNGTLEYTTPKIDQNRGNLTPPGMSGNVSWAMSCVYQADSSGKMKVIIDLASDQSGTYHLYGLTNRAVPSGSGLINFPNTNIAATASSTLDLGASSADHTLGDMMLSGADTALTISNANSVSFKNIIATDTSSIAGAAISLSNGDVTVSPDKTLTVSANIVDVSGANATTLTKLGTGTLVLSGANTYTGDTIVEAGTLSISEAYLFDSSGVIIDYTSGGGVLNLTYSGSDKIAALTVDGVPMGLGTYVGGDYGWLTGSGSLIITLGGFWNGGSGTNTDWSDSANWSGEAPGTGVVLIFKTAGTVSTTLNNNLVSGSSFASLLFESGAPAFTLDGNSVKLTGDGSAKVIILNNSTETQTVNLAIALGANGTINAAAGDIIVGGDISGDHSLTKTGYNQLTLSGANTYTGGTIINAGSVVIGTLGTLGTAGDLTLGGGSLDLGGTSQTVGAVIITAAAASGDTIGNGDLTGTSYAVSATGDVAISANLGGSASLAKSGAGTLTLSGINTYTGLTDISAGTLKLGSADALAGNGDVTVGGTLDLNGFSPTINGFNGAGTVTNGDAAAALLTVGDGGGSGTFSGKIEDGSGTVALTKTGPSTLRLIGANTFSGGMTLNSGGLELANYASGTGTFTVNGGWINGISGTLMTNNSSYVWNGSFSFTGTNGYSWNMGSGPVTINNPLSLTIGNTLTIGGAITGPGGLNAFDITYAVAGGSTYGLNLSAPITLRPNQGIKGAGGNFNGVIDDGGNGYGLSVSIPSSSWGSTASLNATNTFTGPLNIITGTLQIGGSGSLAGGSYAGTISIGALANFNYASSADQILAGEISGVGNLIKSGSGALTLAGNNSSIGGSLTVTTGALTVSGIGITVGSADFKAGTTVNAANLLTVNTSANLAGLTVTASDTSAGFTLGGSNVVNPTSVSHRTLTAQGGTLTISGGVDLRTTNIVAAATTTLVLPAIPTTLGNLTLKGSTIVDGTTLNISAESADAVVTMAADFIYRWEFDGEANKVAITGDLALAGDWTLKLAGTDTPAPGEKYDLFTYTNFNGTFSQPTIDTGEVSWHTPTITKEAGRIYMMFGILGDANGDLVVDAADYIILKQNFGMTGAEWSQGDFNDNGTVDWADLQTLMANFGTRSIGGAPATTPEPATLGLLALGALAVLRRRRGYGGQVRRRKARVS